MILRRITANFRRQDWTAVVVELVIVVLGVFIGIQASNWNADREEHRLERIYLERILADINLSIDTDELNVSRLTGYSDGFMLVVDSLRRCRVPDEQKDAFARGVSDIAKVGPSVFVLSTMDEMVSAGHFSIIRNTDVRDALNGLARDAKYQSNIFNAIYAQLASDTGVTSERAIRIYVDHKTPFDPVAWREMEIDFGALCKDKEYQGAVSNVRYLTDAQISLNSRALEKLRSARATLETELGIAAGSREAKP